MNKNISDKSVQASVQRAIDNDQIFSLKHISQLKDLIRLNITVFVDPTTSQNYSSMSLIQYAIKQNKSEPLKYMLEIAKENKIPNKDILRSNFKYENNNLLFLAIDFNSNSCLETLIDFFKKDPEFSVDVSDPFGESPLTRAIKLGNEEAIKILLKNNASLFYFDQTKNKISTFMPLLNVFFYNRDDNKLKHILDEVIKPCLEEQEKGKFKKNMKEFANMYFDNNFLKVGKEKGKEISLLFREKGLSEARTYLIDIDDERPLPKPIPIAVRKTESLETDNANISDNGNDNTNASGNVNTNASGNENKIICHFCKKPIKSGEYDISGEFFYCQDCEPTYNEYIEKKNKQ